MKSIRSIGFRMSPWLLSLSALSAACDQDPSREVAEASSAAVICGAEAPAVNLGDLPLTFVSNAGQSPEDVRFQGVALGAGTVVATAAGLRLDLADVPGQRPLPAATVSIVHEGAALDLAAAPGEKLLSTTTFITASLTTSQVANHGALAQAGLYPGIDVRISGTTRKLATTYTLAPGASPSAIRWSYEGASQMALDPLIGSVSVVVADGARTLSLGPAEAYQIIKGSKVRVEAAYEITGGSLGITLGDHDASAPVYVTTELLHSPFYRPGGAVAASGRTYAVGRGYHASSSEEDTRGDAYLAVLDNATGQLTSTTLLIGEDDDEGHAVAITGKGEILIAGQTRSLAFPTLGAAQTENAGGSDGFIVKLDPKGAKLLRATYLGSAKDDAATGVTEAPGGGVVVASTTMAPAKALNPAAANFVVTLPAAGPAPVEVPYVITSLDASLAGVLYAVPVKGRRIRRPRVWIDCNGRVRVGVRWLQSLDCTTWPDITYAMRQYGADYFQDHDPLSAVPGLGQPHGGWGYHALRWKFFETHDPLSSNYVPASTTLSWSGLPATGIFKDTPPVVGSVGDDPYRLNDAEGSPAFNSTDPPGDWVGSFHEDIERLALKAALAEVKYGTPVYTHQVSFDDSNNPYAHAMGVEKTTFDMCTSPGSNYAGEGVDTLCDFAHSWVGNIDCSGSNITNLSLGLASFEVSTWGKHGAWFVEHTLLDAYPPGWQSQWWYEPGDFVFDPPVSDPGAAAKLDEAAARLADKVVARVDADETTYTGGVSGDAAAVKISARAVDLH